MGYPLTQNQTVQPLVFFLAASSDHLTGLTGKAASVVVKISKNGATGVSPSGAISEIDATNNPGWYAVAGNATDSNTLGPLILHAKDAASDPFDDVFPVVAYDPQSATRLGLTAIPNVVTGNAGALLTAGSGTAQLNVSGGKAPATLAATDVTGNVASDVQTIKTQTVTCAAGVTVNPNVGTTQPVNFTGTGASALVKSDTEAWLASTPNALQSGRVDSYLGATGAVVVTANATQINGVATTGVTTIGANIGTTQPINFTGTAGAAKVQSDVKTILGTNSQGQAGYVGVDWSAIVNKTATVALTNTTISSSGSGTYPGLLNTDTAAAGSSTTITLGASASAVANIYNGQTVAITGGTGAGQARTIIGYTTGKVATVDWSWTINPDATSAYAVLAADKPALNSSLQVVSSSVAGNIGGDLAGDVNGTVSGVVGITIDPTYGVNVNVIGLGGSPAQATALPTVDGSGRVILQPSGLDAIAVTDPGAPANMTTLPKMMVALWRRFFKKAVIDTNANTITTYADDGTTVNSTTIISSTSTTQTQGPAS